MGTCNVARFCTTFLYSNGNLAMTEFSLSLHFEIYVIIRIVMYIVHIALIRERRVPMHIRSIIIYI